MRYPNYRKRIYRKKAKVQRKKRVYKKKTLVKTIQRVINKNAETKLANINTANSLVFFNSGINSTGDMRQVIPNISRGTGDNDRIGDQIMGQRLKIKGYIKFVANSNAGVPNLSNVIARIMVVSLKSKANYTEATSSAVPLGALIKKGGTTSNFTGVLSDINADINTEVWTKHYDRKFYLTQDYLVTAAGNNNISNTVKFFNINIPCKKLMRYDDSTSFGVLPSNFGPILLVGYSYLDGSSPDSLTTNLGLCYDSDFYYQDM